NFYRTHHRQSPAREATEVSLSTRAAEPTARQPIVNFDWPVADESANATSAMRKKAQAPAARRPAFKTGAPSAPGSPAAAVSEPVRRIMVSSSAAASELSTSSAGASANKPSVPVTRSEPTARAATPAAWLSIEISSAIEGATLAVFVDQQLVASSPLPITRPGEALRLDRPLPAGPHEFRVALYRQDKTLQIEKQGLAELEPGRHNQLTVHVIRRSRMLVKRNADLDILWP